MTLPLLNYLIIIIQYGIGKKHFLLVEYLVSLIKGQGSRSN